METCSRHHDQSRAAHCRRPKTNRRHRGLKTCLAHQLRDVNRRLVTSSGFPGVRHTDQRTTRAYTELTPLCGYSVRPVRRRTGVFQTCRLLKQLRLNASEGRTSVTGLNCASDSVSRFFLSVRACTTVPADQGITRPSESKPMLIAFVNLGIRRGKLQPK